MLLSIEESSWIYSVTRHASPLSLPEHCFYIQIGGWTNNSGKPVYCTPATGFKEIQRAWSVTRTDSTTSEAHLLPVAP